MSEWREYKISDIADVIGGGTPKTSIVDYWNGDIPWLTPRDLTGYSKVYISHGERLITEVGLKNSSARLMPKGTVLLTSRAPIGYVVIAKNDICTNQGFKSLVPKMDMANSEFLYYWLKSNGDYLQQLGTGTTFAEISGSVVKDIDILLPPLEEQKAIAEVLTSLDDKIDLLHRQNKTLEELAQTLFREWFIEEAKDEWEEYKVRDFATHKKVSIKPTQNPDEKFLHFSLPAFDTNKEPNLETGSDIKSNKYQVEPYSILMSKLNPKTPRVWDIYFEPKENSICSTEFQVIHPNDKQFFPFISTLLKSDKVTGDLTMSASGTSGSHQRVKPEDILNISFITPSVEKMEEFSKLLEPNYLKIVQNQQQIRILENMRDTLLPKLMSGEVRVKL